MRAENSPRGLGSTKVVRDAADEQLWWKGKPRADWVVSLSGNRGEEVKTE